MAGPSAVFPGDGTCIVTLNDDRDQVAVYDPAQDSVRPWAVRFADLTAPGEDIDSIHAYAVEQGWV